MFRGTSEPMLVACWRCGRSTATSSARARLRRSCWAWRGVDPPRGVAASSLYGAWLWFVREPTAAGAGRARAGLDPGASGSCRRGSAPGTRSWPRSTPRTTTAISASTRSSRCCGAARTCRSLPVLVLASGGRGDRLVRADRASWLVGSRWRRALWSGGCSWSAMTLDGYPGLERFYLPAAGLTCVLAGVGIVRHRLEHAAVARAPGRARSGWSRRSSRSDDPVHRRAVQRGARAGARSPPQAVTRLDQLSAAVAAVGGHDGVFPCKSSASRRSTTASRPRWRGSCT